MSKRAALALVTAWTLLGCGGDDATSTGAGGSDAGQDAVTGGQGGSGGTAAQGGGAGAGGASGTAGVAGSGATAGVGGAAGSGGAAGMAGAAGTGGAAGAPAVDCGAGAATIVSQGQPGALLLQGTLVTPAQVFAGEVLVVSGTITCVAASCSTEAVAANATVVATGGLVFPGLIDTHNHVLFNVFDETHWTPTVAYTHAAQWSGATGDPAYARALRAKQYLNGETLQGTASPVNVNCELNKYGELKAVIAGTTAMVGASNPAHKICYTTLARTINSTVHNVQVASIFPSASAANAVCNNFTAGTTDAYVIHVAEGINQTARNQFTTLFNLTTPAGCLFDPKTAFVHGNALLEPHFQQMADNDMKLVWSPRSNVGLYGLGTDLSTTTDIPLALSKGLTVSLAPDWTMSGSQNVLDELRFAKMVSDVRWAGQLTPKMLTEMVTINAAKNIGLSSELGSLEVGKRADIMVITGDPSQPYESLINARPTNVRLVLVDGVPLYGDANLQPTAPASPGCELLDLCTCSKFLCVAVNGGTPAQLLGQTFAEIRQNLVAELATYDANGWPNVSGPPSVPLSPISPLYRCPQ